MPKIPTRFLSLSTLVLSLAWIIAAAIAPVERTLGTTVRWVYVHASLTQLSLLFFLGAAILAILVLLGKETLEPWMRVTGWMALGLWAAGFLLSTIPAKLSWGVWVDFHEPRTQMTLRVLAAGILFLLVTLWVNASRFTAIFQIVLSAVLLTLIRQTAVVRHPVNPIAQADTAAIPLAYSIIFLLALLASLSLTWRWVRAIQDRM
ncbi:MAG: hypothetical protein GXP37_03430 [Chloroflexi bacterium]|nr:hypothetical protein [Chloroflexota bacterium]